MPIIAWACGFVAYQLVYPGTVPGWADFWTGVDKQIGFTAPWWLGSSVAAIVVGGLVMLIVGLLLTLPAGRPGSDISLVRQA